VVRFLSKKYRTAKEVYDEMIAVLGTHAIGYSTVTEIRRGRVLTLYLAPVKNRTNTGSLMRPF
jgi:hypothetical protein